MNEYQVAYFFMAHNVVTVLLLFSTKHVIPNAHRESVDVLVKLVEQTDGLYYHVVRSVHVELHLRSRVAVSEAELRFAFRHFAQILH